MKNMDRETIEKAAREYAEENLWYPGETYNDSDIREMEEFLANTYKAGAQWRVNSVWHDASEKLKFNGKVEKEGILLLYSSGQCVFLYLDKDEWESILGYATFVKWAYITDLIPDARKEVQP